MGDPASRHWLLACALFILAGSGSVVDAQYYPPSRYGYDPYPSSPPGYVPRGYRGSDRFDEYYGRRPPGVRSDGDARPRDARRDRPDQSKPTRAAKPGDNPLKGPYQIIISVNTQRVSLYGSEGLIRTAAASTGVRDHPTPLGVFTVLGKERFHRSNIYSNAPMPYMQRITWSGVALHEGVLPGYPASHGCIRMGSDFATFLWRTTKVGARVIIAHDEPAPVDIASPKLFVPAPRPELSAPAVAAGDAKLAVTAAKAAVRGEDEPDLLVTLNDGPAHDAVATPFAQAKFDPYRRGPVSVFVSRKTSKLYVRYDYEPLFEIPVTIREPERPLGTHVLTAVELKGDGMRWTAISIPTPERSNGEAARPRKGERVAAAFTESDVALRGAQTPNAALERIEIPDAVRERIGKLLTVGSSLTISDYGISAETGRETDFIILTK